MVPYPHFAASNLFLENGYAVEQSQYGEAYSYIDEDGLEDCVRRVLVRIPKRLSGPQLRFLRRGLGVSQESFGLLLDRDTQTVARIEKSGSLISRFVDLTIRSLCFQLYEPSISVDEMLSIVDCKSRIPVERILLFYSGERWLYRFDIPRFKVEFSGSHENEGVSIVQDSNSFVRQWRITVNTNLSGSLAEDEGDTAYIPLPVSPKYSTQPHQ